MVKRATGGYINTSRVHNGFQTSAHHTFGVGNRSSKVYSKRAIESHVYSPKPGRTVGYELTRHEINPYKSGALLAGGAAAGYGAYKGVKWAKNNPQQIKKAGRATNKAVGGFYAKHAKGLNHFHTGVAVSGLFVPPKAFVPLQAANLSALAYGGVQAQKQSGKNWQQLKQKRR